MFTSPKHFPVIDEPVSNKKNEKNLNDSTRKKNNRSSKITAQQYEKEPKENKLKVPPKDINRVDSTDSVIYVGTTYHPDPKNIPVIDLTSSKEKLTQKEAIKTVYLAKRNFDGNKFPINTTSLINLPVIKKVVPKKPNSASVLEKYHSRLKLLDIPAQFLCWDDLNYNDSSLLQKSELTDNDQEMIEWILEKDNEGMEGVTATSSSGYNSLCPNLSLHDMLNLYNVSSNDSL